MTIVNTGEQLDSSSKWNLLFCQVRFVTTQWFDSPCDQQARCTVFLVGLLDAKSADQCTWHTETFRKCSLKKLTTNTPFAYICMK